MRQVACKECGGLGFIKFNEECVVCRGTGFVDMTEEDKARIEEMLKANGLVEK